MFKVVLICIALPTLLILLSGCSTQIQTDDSSNDENDNTKVEVGQQMAVANMPEREADISGVVKSIIGNEITITQIDMQAMREQMASNKSEENDLEKKETTKNNFVVNQSAGGMGGPGMGGGGGTRPQFSEEQKKAMQEEMLKNSLGDVKVIFPVGIPMYKMGGAEATLADVVVDLNITVWLNQDSEDRKIAEFVNIR